MRVQPRPHKPAGSLLLLCSLVIGVLGLGSAATAAPSDSPPIDPNARGAIALCGPSGQQLTGGLLSTQPFVWKAVGTTVPPVQVAGAAGLAELNIYQERPGVAPSEWSGINLTAFSRYTTPMHPTAQFTSKDISLGDFVGDYPPQGAGYYVLRLIYGKVASSNTSPTYATTTIQVSGNAWHVVAGADLSCSAGQGKSGEVYAGVAQAAPAPGYVEAVSSASKVAKAEPAGSVRSSAATPPRSSAGGSTSETASTKPSASLVTHSSPASDGGWIAAAVVGGLALLGGGFTIGRRRRG